jgi:hypothetical protein
MKPNPCPYYRKGVKCEICYTYPCWMEPINTERNKEYLSQNTSENNGHRYLQQFKDY